MRAERHEEHQTRLYINGTRSSAWCESCGWKTDGYAWDVERAADEHERENNDDN